MYLHNTKVFKVWDTFYKDWAVFKWKIRPTMADAWREYQSLRAYKYRICPKAIRRTFKEDYQAFKERRGQQSIYVKIAWAYDNDVNMWQFQVILPVYKIENGRIKTIYTEPRGWYPLWILEVVKCNSLPREEWGEIEPGEKYIDCINKYWRDADMFAALGWVHADHNNMVDDRDTYANITWAWKPIPNMYNAWYIYENNRVVELNPRELTPEEHLVECMNRE